MMPFLLMKGSTQGRLQDSLVRLLLDLQVHCDAFRIFFIHPGMILFAHAALLVQCSEKHGSLTLGFWDSPLFLLELGRMLY